MKNTMLAAALAALAIGSASAETIYITGSTAFRGAANNSINQYITNNGGSLVAADAAIGSAGNAVWSMTNGDKIVAYWSGSEAGIQSVAGPASPVYAKVVSTNLATNAVGPAGYIKLSGTGASTVWKQVVTNNGVQLQAPNTLVFWDPAQSFTISNGVAVGTIAKVTNAAQIAFADTYQASSAFGSGAKVAYYGTNSLNGNSITDTNNPLFTNSYVAINNDTIVGGVGFAFIVSPNYADGYKTAAGTNIANGNTPVIVNMTQALGKKLYTNGVINAAELSGGLDTNATAYAVGRNIDSGTRIQAMALLGLSSLVKSTGVNSGIKQYVLVAPGTAQKNIDGTVYATNSGTTMLITNWNVDLVNGKLCTNGDSGYASGGTLCDLIAKSTNLPSNSVIIGYAGINDAVGKSASMISYNGVFPTVSAIQSGNYPFWCYEHLMVAPTASATTVSFASNVASTIKGLSDSALLGYAKGTISYATLTNTVSRAALVDGGTVTKKWSTNGLLNW